MKKLVVLSGNSPRNQEWGESAVEHYKNWFDDVYMQYYDHWAADTKEINIKRELEKLREATRQTDIEYYFFAKSIGSLLTLLATQAEFVTPTKCVFFGMPLELAAGELFKEDWTPLSQFRVPAIAFHNEKDPISYSYTKEALARHNPEITLYTMPKDNHDYVEFEDYDETINKFING